VKAVAERTLRRGRAVGAAIALAGLGACAQVIGANFTGFQGMESSGGAAGANVSGTGGERLVTGGGGGADAAPSLGGGGGGASGSSGLGGQPRADGAAGAAVTDASADAGDTEVDREDGPTEARVPADAGPAPVDGPAGRLVINEIHAVDPDWIEIYNPGPGPVSLDGLGLTQAMGTNGPPQALALLTFPAGAVLSAGEFLLVIGKMASIGGPFMDCSGLALSCYWVSWGVSASGGESIYLVSVSPPGLSVFEQVAYPLDPLAPPPGNSYGRYPDGVGSFTATLPTPAYANQR
jgi:hypothetical protein